MMDNYSTPFELFDYLKTQNIHACGKLHPNRSRLPQVADDKELKQGEFDYRVSNHGIYFFKWKDTRPVHFLLNYHGTEVTTDGTKIDVPAPSKIVKDCCFSAHFQIFILLFPIIIMLFTMKRVSTCLKT
jgi:hypothetical protein